MAWRAPEHGATASGPSATALEARAVAGGAQDRGGAVGGTPGVPRRRGARAGAVLGTSPVLSAPGPDAVRIRPKSHKKAPSAIIPRNEAFAPGEGASKQRDAEIGTVLRRVALLLQGSEQGLLRA